jgi:hypothetical protein
MIILAALLAMQGFSDSAVAAPKPRRLSPMRRPNPRP